MLVKAIGLAVALALMCAVLSACDDSTTSVPNLTGSYRGIAVFHFAPADTDTLDAFATLLQNGSTLTGTWVLKMSAQDSVSGTITGGSVVRLSGTGLTGIQVSASLASSGSACPG